MRIGIAGPMTLRLLDFPFEKTRDIPGGYNFPMVSMLINALLNRGYEVVAYTTSTDIDIPVVYKNNRLTICIAKRRNKHSGRDFFAYERKQIQTLIKKHPADVINAQWSYEFAWAAIESKIPTLVTLQDHAFTILKYKVDAYRIVRYLMNSVVITKSKYISTNSQYLYNQLNKYGKKKARIIPNFWSNQINMFYSENIKKRKIIISISNGYGRRKNISTALLAFKFLKQRVNDVEYFLVGDAMGEGEVAHRYALKRNLTEGVKFIGNLPFKETMSLLSDSLIFLHPSREESFGMAVLEAMLLGVPVVGGANSGNIPYLLEGGDAGVLCNINCPHDIANALYQLLSNRDSINNYRNKGRKTAISKYNEDIVVSKYLEYFKYIIENNTNYLQ
jgi:L-malate glycosyltransferase